MKFNIFLFFRNNVLCIAGNHWWNIVLFGKFWEPYTNFTQIYRKLNVLSTLASYIPHSWKWKNQIFYLHTKITEWPNQNLPTGIIFRPRLGGVTPLLHPLPENILNHIWNNLSSKRQAGVTVYSFGGRGELVQQGVGWGVSISF